MKKIIGFATVGFFAIYGAIIFVFAMRDLIAERIKKRKNDKYFDLDVETEEYEE